MEPFPSVCHTDRVSFFLIQKLLDSNQTRRRLLSILVLVTNHKSSRRSNPLVDSIRTVFFSLPFLRKDCA